MGNRSFFNALHDREGDFLLATVLEGPAQGERVLLRNTAPVWPEELPAFWGEHLPALCRGSCADPRRAGDILCGRDPCPQL